jgi:hypothetical protein
MFIPNYQIQNILKDFAQQLRNGNHRQDTGHRLETVVKKVAGTIMDRVARLSEEEARLQAEAARQKMPPLSSTAEEKPPSAFHYHTIDKNCQKIKHCLAVENPEQFINRFQSTIDAAAPASDGNDAPAAPFDSK